MKRSSVVRGGAVIGLIMLNVIARAQVGDNNPTGPAGQFNGNVNTACSYDPYTANATRSITDLVVSGSVGSYPLAFTRTMTSRYIAGFPLGFGQAGNWRCSCQWSVRPISYGSTNSGTLPSSYTVDYPDGRMVIFHPGRNNDPDFEGLKGVRDRFEPVSNGNCYLRLPDGGKIRFRAYESIDNVGPDGSREYVISWTFAVTAIIDPYGQTTTVSYPSDGSVVITEPAGRMLKIFSKPGPAGDTVIDRVEEWMTSSLKGRTVTYNYLQYSGTNYSALTGVSYPDGTSASYTYQNSDNTSSNNGSTRLLIKTCVDPMYAGPMWKIAYTFVPSSSSLVYGQLQSENYFDGTNVGAAVSTLSVTGTSTRTETRGDGPSRTFGYNGYNFSNGTDFNGAYPPSPRTWDSAGFVASITDKNGNTTRFTNDPWTGNVKTITYPLTPSDSALGLSNATTQTVYTGSGSDPNNPYYVYGYANAHRGGRHRHKRGFSATYTRDANKRITAISYPDGGSETFSYNGFGEVLTHRMRTGGLEIFTYDGRGLLTEYRDPYHLATADSQNPSVPTSSTPSLRYAYYTSGPNTDMVQSVTDARGNTTTFTYNARGQLLTNTPPGVAHPITNAYNPNGNGTLVSVTNELQKQTSFAYDDYKRVTSTTLPPPSPGPSPSPTFFSYNHTGGTAADYTHTSSNPTRVTLPSGNATQTLYDNNFLELSVTAGLYSNDTATTSFTYDNNGNLKTVKSPNGQSSGAITQYFYDQQNRLTDVDDAMVNDSTTPHKNSNGHTVSWTYDQANNVLTMRRANNQLITDFYDSMNRVVQTNTPQDPDPGSITKYTYYTSGLLHTMQDPHLFAINSTASYSYSYDLMGRQTSLIYPPDSNNAATTEGWSYDTAGNLATFTNRAGNVQTFSPYDARNRMTGFSWSDGTPTVSFGYDDASRLTSVVDANATISRTYFDDNTLHSETTTYADNTPRTVTYSYNADLFPKTIQYPANAYSFTFAPTARNQLDTIVNNSGGATIANYGYDPDGNLTSRILDNSTSSSYVYDALDRITHVAHTLASGTRTFDYGYDSVNNLNWNKRDGGNGDVFDYDLSDQVTATLMNVANPSTTPPGAQTISYDANGNRMSFTAYGRNDTYTTNDLNQYSTRNSGQAAYDAHGNMTGGLDGSTYIYDAQKRLKSATKGGTTETFKYDGLNRQVSRTIGTGSPVYNVYDGWELIAEYAPGATSPSNAYLPGPGGLIKNLTTNRYYYQDASGSTSHLASNTGALLESYRYDVQGTPTFYDPSNTQRTSGSAYAIRHLFTGQQWYSELGLYNLRNRYYSPDIGRFLQGDPIGFSGDATNLYRYCGNNPMKWYDPSGFGNITLPELGGAPDIPAPDLFDPNDFLGDDQLTQELLNGNIDTSEPLVGSEPVTASEPSTVSETSGEVGSGIVTDLGPGRADPGGFFTGFGSGSYLAPRELNGDPTHPRSTREFIAYGNQIEHGDTTDTSVPFDPVGIASGAIAAKTAGMILLPTLRNLGVQLAEREAGSAFTATGQLSPGAISSSRLIVPAAKLINPQVPAGLAKYSTRTFASPSGPFQVHFYMDPLTMEIFYGLDYKVVFGGP
jgi:RHS repeat-associated protein